MVAEADRSSTTESEAAYPAATTTTNAGRAATVARATMTTAYHGWAGDVARMTAATRTRHPSTNGGRRATTHTATAATASTDKAPAMTPGTGSRLAMRNRPPLP